MDVSVIIVNYNCGQLIFECVNSIYHFTIGLNFEIIVIDNNSSDDSLNSYLLPLGEKIQLICSSVNLGFGRANNKGTEVAKGKYLFFLNPDTLLLNNAILMFYNFYQLNYELSIGALGGLLYDNNKNCVHSYGTFPSITDSLKQAIGFYLAKFGFNINKQIQFIDKNHDRQKVDYITGADLFIKKSTFINIGEFDPNFFMYFEESELQYRLIKNNFVNYLIKGPQIIHFESVTLRKVPNIKRIYMLRSLFQFYSKHSKVNIGLHKVIFLFIWFPTFISFKYKFRENWDYFKELLKFCCR